MTSSIDSSRFQTCVLIGLGYIGLPTAAVIARHGIDVIGVDINERIVDGINAGTHTSVEPGLTELVEETVRGGRLRAQTTVPKGDVFIIAVPTPFEGGFKPDLSYVQAATLSVAPVLRKGNVVVVESTIPVGATEQVGRWLRQARPDLSFSERGCQSQGETNRRAPDVLIAHSPERILPGQMLRELSQNDRIIGGVCPLSAEVTAAFYQRFVKGACITTDSRTAELCKLSENAFRDVNIAFANELALVCDELQVDVWRLIALANRHPRVNILKPGPGVGGHCIAVDPWFIVSALTDKTRLIREARWINGGRPRQVVRGIIEALKHKPVRSVACFGLSYKADVDDVRESPAVEVVELLAKELQLQGANLPLLVTEPHLAGPLPQALAELGVVKVDTERALEADMLVMLVDHSQFAAIPAERLAGKATIDTRGVWPAAEKAW